ncbi:MAG: hypothetical protein HYU99_02820 [Deltaproteobacteria bacterium]|nr:hypothetical protein [Deltaproteobacteria bacterium]
MDDWSGWGEDYSGEVISRDMGCLFAMNKAIFSAAEEEDGGLSDDNAVIKNVVEGFMADGGKPEDAGEEDWPALIHHVLDGSAGDGWENMVESAADVDDAIDVPEFLEKYDAASRAFGAVSGTLAEQIDALYADSETAGDTTTFEVCSGIESGTYEAKAVVGPMLVAEDEEEFSTAYGSPEGLRLHFNLLKNCREEGTCRDMADKPSAFLGFMAGFSGNYSGVFGAGTTPDENVVKGMFRIAENCTGVSAGNIRVCAEGMHTAVYQGDGWSAFQNSGGQFDGTKLNLWGDYWTRQAEIGIDSMTAAFNRMDGEISGTTGTLNTCISYLLSRGIYDTGACSLGRFFGSYATSLKQTGNTLGFEDPPTMVSALLATGQNLFGFEATDGVTGDDDSGYYWPQLIDLLEEARGTDLKIFATLREKHLTGTTANRWGVSGNSTTAQWAAAQVAAAAELGGLSVDYPNLVGFTIDDFSGYPCTVEDEDYSTWSGDGCYSRAQIRAITNAAHSANPNFKFWPTVYYPHLPWHIVPAHALGTPYGVRLYSDEYATVKYIFTLSSLPATAILKFHAADTNTEDIDYVDMLRKSLIINSQTVYDQSMRGDQHVETYNANIASYLQAGANTIAFKVSSTSDSNIYHHKMYYIWDVLLTVDGVAFTSWNPVYSKKESTASYTNLDNVSVTNAGKVFAKSTANYVITSDIDGILAPFPAAGGFYSAVPYADLVAKTKSALGDRDLITVNYGMMWGTAISNPVLDAQIRANALVADGIVVWNFPLPFYQLGTQGGIFQQYASDNPSFNLMSFFPGNQQGLEGWYQKWTTKERLSGAVTVKVKDDRTSDYSTDYFVKTLYSPDTGTIYYQDAIGGNEGTETVTINLGSTPVLLALKVDETDGVGNFPTKIWFHVTNSSGAPLVSTDFDFVSGTTNNNIVQTYNTLKDAFLGLW